MGLIEVQRTLAQLYTNVELRQKFLDNPQQTAIDLGLNPLDSQQLSKLSAFHLREFANSLHYKRMGEVQEILPTTEKSLKAKFNEYFLEFAKSYIPSGVKKHRDDAIAFAKFLNEQAVSIPAWCRELAVYEAMRLELGETKKLIIFQVFQYPIKEIFQAIFNNEEPKPNKKRTLAIWLRIPGQINWQHYLLSVPRI